jgi:hypothetical protein
MSENARPEPVSTARPLPAELLPRFAANLNAMAECHGFAVSAEVDFYENDPKRIERIFATWAGTVAQFRAMGLLAPSQRLPLTRGTLTFPVSAYVRPWLTGAVTIGGPALSYCVDFGPLPLRIVTMGELQIITYVSETAYHGSAKDLQSEGLCQRVQLPTSKRKACSSRWNAVEQTAKWQTRRQPDGLFVHWLEKEAARQRRAEQGRRFREQIEQARSQRITGTVERGTHLRLVVDNTRPPTPAST